MSVSQSKIYGLLKRLYQQRWVHRYYDKDSEAQRVAIALDWGEVIINKEFNLAVIKKENDYMIKKLFPIFSDVLIKAMKDLHEDPDTKKWIPQADDNWYCKFVVKVMRQKNSFLVY